ncbi:transposase family protein, partial [Streptomyces javensis]|uniref:transposase family protein n=1 Tax=Streptomyces javensis TaxID=114698 RepID=UPI0031E2690D
MYSNISIPGLEEFIITKSLEVEGFYQLHVELVRKPHQCPDCRKLTQKVHDYRLQKIQHTEVFGRNTLLF